MKPRPVRKKLVEVRKRYDPIKKTIIKSHPKPLGVLGIFISLINPLSLLDHLL